MKSATTKGQTSERDQFWLDHEAAQAASGRTAKDYAASQGLSQHAFYQARKRLRALGLLPAAPGRGAPVQSLSGSQAVSFSRVTVTPGGPASRFRVELAGGVALAWSGDEVPEPVIVLLERLARPA